MNTQVLTISSHDPSKDADALVAVFSGTDFTREDQENESIALIGEELGTFIIIHGDPISLGQVMVVSGDTLKTVGASELSFARLVSSQQLVQTDDMTMIVILELPGSTQIVLTTPTVLESNLGRLAVARAVVNRTGRTTATSPTSVNGKAIMEPEAEAVVEVAPSKILPQFPTIDVTLLSTNDHFEEFPVNSPTAVPFENELFVGQVMLILRPEDPTTDPYWNERIFSKKKRRFVFQLQGKFKRKPRGLVYAGAEISDPMKIGLVAKGMCSILLNLVRSFNSSMHYCFGDKKGTEQAHIVIPAWNFFENFVVTKAGETPPTMGEPFPESKENKDARKAGKTVADWNTEDTYSMSYYSMYIDFPTWKIVKVPVAPELDLRTFWNKSFLKIVLYENETPAKDGRHLTKDNSYFFALKMRFYPDGNKHESDERTLPWKLKGRLYSESNLNVTGLFKDDSERYLRCDDNPVGEAALVEESDGEEYYFDAEEPNDSPWLSPNLASAPLTSESAVSLLPPKTLLTGGGQPTVDGLAKLNCLCPMFIDMCSKGKYVTVYAFANSNGSAHFRTPSKVAEYFTFDAAKKAVESTWSPRLSNAEKARRMLGQAYATSRESGTPEGAATLLAFHELKTEYDLNFLQRTRQSVLLKRSRIIKKSCFVARAISDHHWIEEWAKISEHQIVFYHPEKQNDNYRMSLASIVRVEKLNPEDSPTLPTYSFMAIETMGRTIYLMFASEQECDEWVEYLIEVSTFRPSDPVNEISSPWSQESSKSESRLMSVDDPTEEFLHKSSMWNCKQRKILNCRKFCFCPSGEDPHKVVQDALTRALEPREDSEEANLRAFLNSTSLLKGIRLEGLGEKERLAFFLNLYHVMIMHAFLVLGPPDSSFQWVSYFNTISYQCSDEIFSLTELEHNIIRAAMTYPSNFLSKFVLPKSQFRFALTQSDYRINFALNCGSISNPGKVPIYTVERLDQQLDLACCNYLDPVTTVIVKRNQTMLTLPRICQWFADDFGPTTRMIQQVQRFINASKSRAIQAAWSKEDGRFNDLTLKYLPYNFECRHLTLLDSGPMFTIE